jgi:hypothetical protein
MTTNGNSVTLDADLSRLIESNRILATDDARTILRRLLKIDKTPDGWFAQGVFLPNGTKIRMGYGDNPAMTGKIDGGKWVVQNRKFDSPSTAATALVSRGRGRSKARVNGWLYWQVLKPGESDWALLDSLRIGNPAGLASNVHRFHRGKEPGFRTPHGRAS